MKNYKKPLLIGLIALDFAVTVFLFVISIILLVKMGQHPNNPAAAAADSSGMIKYFIENPTAFLCIVVIPLFILLAVNIVGLVIFVRKTSKREPAKLADLSDAQKEALRQELLKDLQGGAKEETPAEQPAEEPAEEQPEEGSEENKE